MNTAIKIIDEVIDDMISHDFWWNYNWQHNCLEELKERIENKLSALPSLKEQVEKLQRYSKEDLDELYITEYNKIYFWYYVKYDDLIDLLNEPK